MSVNPQIESSWKEVLQEEFWKEYFEQIKQFLLTQKQAGKVTYPSWSNIFNAFNLTPFHDLKVVILGQDPYHGAGQAHGLSFSVQDWIAFPPSLQNIFKEIQADLGYPMPASGNLEKWAKQWVFLLNSILTVEANNAASHQSIWREIFTDAVIKTISDHKDHVVFLLWWKFAQSKTPLIDKDKHLILTAAHPSPFAAHKGFFWTRHFSKTNQYLSGHGLKEIDWRL